MSVGDDLRPIPQDEHEGRHHHHQSSPDGYEDVADRAPAVAHDGSDAEDTEDHARVEGR